MKLWPFRREPEKREAQPFTDAIVAAIQAQATGAELAQPNATAAVETAAGFYSRALASAVVMDAGIAEAALTPSVLSLAGRDLIRRGASVFVIELDGDMLMLRPVGSWDVRGGPRESSWWYRCDVFGPSGNETRFVPGDSVVHFRYAVDPSRPWHGVSPIAWARLTAAGLANLEAMVTSEAGSPFGYLLPTPADVDDTDDDDDPNAALRADLAGARGRTLIVHDPALDEDNAGRGPRPGAYRHIARFGANPPETVEGLRTETGRDILAACGLSSALFNQSADGTSRREAYRQALHIGIRPVVRLMTDELRRKLDAPDLSLDLTALHASDTAGRTRSFKQLVEAGVHPDDAAAQTGIVLTRETRAPTPSGPPTPEDGA